MDTPNQPQTTSLSFESSPGFAIVKEVKEEEGESIVLSQKKQGRIILGEIISMGGDTTGSAGELVKASEYGKVGDKIWFLHYYDEGGVDVGEIDGQKYYFVKFGDFRAKKL
jgi:co-chaperonin GroES (HSP10)